MTDQFGFANVWIDTVIQMQCVDFVRCFFSVSGKPRGFVISSCGLRQSHISIISVPVSIGAKGFLALL